jgi:hypothetical protein
VESLALCRFETDDASALVNVGWGSGPGGLRASGTDGRIEVRYDRGRTGPYAPIEIAEIVSKTGSVTPLELDPRRNTHLAMLVGIGRSLLAGRPPIADAEAGGRAIDATVGA